MVTEIITKYNLFVRYLLLSFRREPWVSIQCTRGRPATFNLLFYVLVKRHLDSSLSCSSDHQLFPLAPFRDVGWITVRRSGLYRENDCHSLKFFFFSRTLYVPFMNFWVLFPLFSNGFVLRQEMLSPPICKGISR